MNILHVIPTLDPAKGGPPKIAIRLAAAQVGLGHTVHMLAYRMPGTEKTVEEELQSVPFAGRVTFEFLPPPNRLELLNAGQAGRAARRHLTEGCDFLHLHSLWNPLTTSAARAARDVGTPYTLLVNGMLDPWSLSQHPTKKKIAMMLGYRKMLNQCAFLHLGNVDERRLIEPLGLTCPSEIIPNGIFEDEVAGLPESGAFFKLCPGLKARPYILFLGRLHYKKGLDYLADAFAIVAAKLPDVQLVVAGPDDGERVNFERRIAQANLSNRVHVVGPLYGADKLAALADAACFCLPSRQEGFSVAITEALACGVPVVISDACHFPEVATEKAGFVTQLDPKEIGEALIKVLPDPRAARLSMGARGKKMVLDRYTWPKVAEQTISAYSRYIRSTNGHVV